MVIEHKTDASDSEPADCVESPEQHGSSAMYHWILQIAGPLIVVGVILVCFVGWSIRRFGHPLVGIAYLNGVIIKPEKQTVDLGHVRPGTQVEAVFRLMNLTRQTVTIIGAQADCSCIVTSGLPMKIPPGSSSRFVSTFTARSIDADHNVTRRILLHLNVDAPEVVLIVTANVGASDR